MEMKEARCQTQKYSPHLIVHSLSSLIRVSENVDNNSKNVFNTSSHMTEEAFKISDSHFFKKI